MFRKVVFTLSLIMVFAIYAGAEEITKVKSQISDVTVFLQGAQITRTAKVNVSAGISEFVFEGVSPYLNTTSIKAGGEGNFIIMGVKYNTAYVQPGAKKENPVPQSIINKLRRIQDSLTDLGFEIERLTYKQSAWTKEKNMLENNKLMNGQGKSDSLPLFMDAMDFYRKKIHEINDALLDLRKAMYNASNLKTKLQLRYNELNQYKQRLESENQIPAKHLYQIIVTVSSKYVTSGSIFVNYYVNNASWSPSYDLRADNTSDPVQLNYKAHILQNTGEDWDNVKLTLSTMNPNRSNDKPVLSTWYLRFYSPGVAVISTSRTSNFLLDVEEESKSESISKDGYNAGAVAKQPLDYMQQITNMANVEFRIDLNYNIPSDGKSHQVNVMEKDIPSTYRHYVVPKVDREAYLTARLTGWESLNLLPGQANIYFQNTFVGTATIDPNTIEDTLDISLGRDQGIAVDRKKLKDKEITKIIGQNKEKTITIEVTVRNKKSIPTEVTIQDQIPVSGDSEIKVFFDEQSLEGAIYNSNTGMLTWHEQLAPQETKKVVFTYVIRYPKEKIVQ